MRGSSSMWCFPVFGSVLYLLFLLVLYTRSVPFLLFFGLPKTIFPRRSRSSSRFGSPLSRLARSRRLNGVGNSGQRQLSGSGQLSTAAGPPPERLPDSPCVCVLLWLRIETAGHAYLVKLATR